MKKVTVYFLAILMFSAFAGCEKDKKSNPPLDEEVPGVWFKLTGEDQIAVDVDGYFWGVQIEENGDVTVARLDYGAGSLVFEESGPAFRITEAEGGSFSGSSDGDSFSGTYQLGTVSNAGYDYHSLNLSSSQITDYLPGGTGGDWSVTGKYIKLYTLDYKDASIGESALTVPKAPWSLEGSYNYSSYKVNFTFWARYSDEIDHFQFAFYEEGSWVDLSFETAADPTDVSNDQWQESESMTYNGGDPWPAGNYKFKVKAINAEGESAYSNEVEVVVSGKKSATDFLNFDYLKLAN